MKRIGFLLIISFLALPACRKKAPTASPPLSPEQAAALESEYVLPTNQVAAARPSGEPATRPAASPGSPPAPAAATTWHLKPVQERLNGAIHAGLTLQLRRFVQKNGRMPEGFAEFVSSAMDSAPLAPDGMKFVIDHADQTVKAVKK